MYNSQIKNRYLEQDKYRERTERFFNAATYVETELDKDLYDFTDQNIDDLLISVNSPSKNTLNIMLTVYRQYTDWALKNHLVADGINHYDFFHINDTEKYINKFVADSKKISYEQYKQIETFTSNPLDRFVIQCLWYGIKGPCMVEISIAKIEDIDFDSKSMKVYRLNDQGYRELDRIIAIDSYMISTAIEASNTVSEEISNYIGLVSCPLEGDTIIKSRVRKDRDETSVYNGYNRLYQRFRRTIREFGLERVNPVDLMMNGMVHQLNLLAQEKNQSIFDILSSEESKTILGNFGVAYSNLPLKRRISQYI